MNAILLLSFRLMFRSRVDCQILHSLFSSCISNMISSGRVIYFLFSKVMVLDLILLDVVWKEC